MALERESTVAHAHGSLLGANAVGLWYGWALLRRGDLRDAEALLRQAVRTSARYNGGASTVHGFPTAGLAQVLLERGEVLAAHGMLSREERLAAGRSNAARFMRRSRLELFLALGRTEDAVRVADTMAREDAWIPRSLDAPWRGSAARAYAAIGRTGDALAIAEDELDHAQRFGAPGVLGAALRLSGELRDDLGHLETAVDVLEASTRRLERARARVALGRALAARGRGGAARELLARGLADATVCGADGLAQVAAGALADAGGAPDVADVAGFAGADALSTLERRVAELASAGREVHDIAQAAHLTPHAVEVHLDGVRRKLGSSAPERCMAALA